MVVFILLVSVVALAVCVRLAPTCHVVHAGVAVDLPRGMKPSQKMASPSMFETADGKRFSRKNRFYGRAFGASMEAYGIPDGAEFFGEYLPADATDADRIAKLSSLEDPIVVIDCETEKSQTGKRLRCISDVDADGTLHFYPYFSGKVHTQRHVSDVVCVVDTVAV